MEPAHALPQHPHFAATLSLLGAPPDLAETAEGPVIVTRRRIGPLQLAAALRTPALSEGSLRRLRQAGLRFCEPDGRADMRQAGFRQVVTPSHVAELGLAGDSRDRRARMHGKWRNRLARAEEAGLRVEDMAFAGPAADWLIRREMEQRRDRRYRALHPDFARAWAAADPGAARLFTARDGTSRVAAMLFLIHGTRATYHIGWSGGLGRAASAHHLILARAGDWLAERGVTRLDLGLVDTETAPGLARFKIGAGATVRPLGGSWIALPGL